MTDNGDLKQERWEFIFNKVKDFYDSHGFWPKHKRKYEGIALGNWLQEQRRSFKKGRLIKIRCHMLENIGFNLESKVLKEKPRIIKEYVFLIRASQMLKCSKHFLKKGIIPIKEYRDPKTNYRRYKVSEIEEYLKNKG
jgi:hypothetical protein